MQKQGLTDCELGDDLKCVHCGFQFKSTNARRQCPTMRDPQKLTAKQITWAGRATAYAGALTRWFAASRPKRTPERIAELLVICETCEKFKDGACDSCGCKINRSPSAWRNKLAMATESCPLGKWSADVTSEPTPSKHIRVGFVIPDLQLGGVESWLWSLVSHWHRGDVIRCSSVAVTRASYSPEMVHKIAELAPVAGPIDDELANYSADPRDTINAIGKASDVLLVWGVHKEAILAAKASGARVVGVAHACREWWTPQAEHVDHWVSVHEVAAGSIPAGRPYTIIGNGIDVERCSSSLTRTQARERLGLPADAKVYGYVGRFSAAGEKRIKEISEAIRHLPHDWWGVMVGSGRAIPTPHERLIVAPATRSIGDVWRAVDVGVIASEHESWCLAADEIHAAGIPLVATPVGAIVDATEWLPQPPSAAEIARACELAYGRQVSGLRPERTAAAMAEAWTQYISRTLGASVPGSE